MSCKFIYNTEEELWTGFVEEMTECMSERVFSRATSIDKRCWFADWTDMLAQNGEISREMADSVGWEDRSNPYWP